ncbi:MAG: hypothetical protein KAH33_00310 [Candidatus Delongbacteria bacterium]|nr:hypothetical protein [Candidatus Delongbacteria bacterium]
MKKYTPLTTLLEEYKKENEKVKELREKRKSAGIIKLEITKADSVDFFLVSANLNKASLSVVLKQLLDKIDIPYLVDNVSLSGKVTTRFEKIPLLKAINILLESKGLFADFQKDVLVVKYGFVEKLQTSATLTDSSSSFTEDDTAEPSILFEVPLNYLETDIALTLLNSLIGDGDLKFGTQPNINTIFLSGPKNEIIKATKLLKKADREPSHIIIEALVVEFDVGALEQLGADVTDVASGALNNGSTNIGEDVTSIIRTITFTGGTHLANTDPETFTAMIDALISDNKARVVSRPYISTLSGEKATIDITHDRHVIVQESSEGASITTIDPISAGVMLEITPTVLADDIVRIEVDVEDSHFLTVSGDIVVEVDKSKAHTTMQIESGQSIIIGGLTKNKESFENSGLPWLRHIPIINWFTAKQKRILTEEEVIIYITPHIWRPDLNIPLVKPDILKVKESSNPSLFEKLGIRDDKDR